MNFARVQTGGKKSIEVFAVRAGSPAPPLTGLTDLEIKIRRNSDGFYFDWSNNQFKIAASVVTLTTPLVEVDAVTSPGEYKLNKAGHVDGFDTSSIVNPTAGPIVVESYSIRAEQTTLSTAVNLPQVGGFEEGGFVDLLDSSVAAVKADTAELLVRLTIARAAALDKISAIDINSNLTRQALFNRLELKEGSTDNWELYNDAGSAVIFTWDVKDKGGFAILIPAATPARRIPS